MEILGTYYKYIIVCYLAIFFAAAKLDNYNIEYTMESLAMLTVLVVAFFSTKEMQVVALIITINLLVVVGMGYEEHYIHDVLAVVSSLAYSMVYVIFVGRRKDVISHQRNPLGLFG